MTNDILNAANLYAKGLQDVVNRRAQWLEKYKEVLEHLKQTAAELNEKAAYKQGFYVDTNHAFNEEINGTCANIPSLTLRTGKMPLMLTFRNAMNDKREYMEEGFHLTFTPTITGEIIVLLLPHHSSVSSGTPEYINLAVMESPAALTNAIVDDIVARGIEMAFYSSFTGMVDLQKKEMSETQKQHQYSPIGFTRYESTEKVK